MKSVDVLQDVQTGGPSSCLQHPSHTAIFWWCSVWYEEGSFPYETCQVTIL